MGPKINGNSVSDLVLAAVQQQLEVKMGDYKDVLNNALARINTLEEEIAQCLSSCRPGTEDIIHYFTLISSELHYLDRKWQNLH